MHVCVYACMCVCVCVAKQVAVELRCHATALIFSFMGSFVSFIKQQVLFRVDFLSVTLDHGVQCPRMRARGQNLGHLKKSFFFCFLARLHEVQELL